MPVSWFHRPRGSRRRAVRQARAAAALGCDPDGCYHAGRAGAAMRTIFIDCNDQLDQVFARVHRSDDPPITVNTNPVAAAELPRLIDGHDICLDDHSYMPTEIVAKCKTLKHIIFLGTGAGSYMD